MLFILLFMTGGLVLPLILDSRKNRGNNIFKRSGRDILNYEFTKKVFQTIHLSTRRVSATFAGALAFASTIGAVYIALKLAEAAHAIFNIFGK